MTRLMLECASTFNQDFKKVFFSLCPVLIAKTSSNRPLAIVFCWIVVWIQPDSSGCQQDFFCLKMISEGFRSCKPCYEKMFFIFQMEKTSLLFLFETKKIWFQSIDLIENIFSYLLEQYFEIFEATDIKL